MCGFLAIVQFVLLENNACMFKGASCPRTSLATH